MPDLADSPGPLPPEEMMFREGIDQQQPEQLDRIGKRIAEANDIQPNVHLQTDMAGEPTSDAAEMQRQLEHNSEMRNPSITLESRITNAKDLQ